MSYVHAPDSSYSPPQTPLLPLNRTSSSPYPTGPYDKYIPSAADSGSDDATPSSVNPLPFSNSHLPPIEQPPQLPGRRSFNRRLIMRRKMGISTVLVGSYVLDWLVIIALGVACIFMNDVKPNMRPFALDDSKISFPHVENETVPPKILFLCNSILPIIIILLVSLVFVPGRTVPKGTPKALIWKRKLWELHVGWLGIALSLFLSWFVTNGLKNMEGRPRPDMLSRCKPDINNVADHYVGGFRLPVDDSATKYTVGHLVSASICTNTDTDTLWDGFRSFPSGHSSSAAAGLIYLSLFLASKFAVTIPYLSPSAFDDPQTSYAAFPSRTTSSLQSCTPTGKTEVTSVSSGKLPRDPNDDSIELIAPYPGSAAATGRAFAHNRIVTAARMQAAAPPLYLLLLTLLPTFTAIFIAASRWFDFRHHNTDILTGFFIGTVSAIFAFRYYHLPISYGGGWAWGPRSRDKALWAGVGSYSYATDNEQVAYRTPGDLEAGLR